MNALNCISIRQRFLFLIPVLSVLIGCAPGEGPYQQVQMCLKDDQGLTKFTDTLKRIARSEGMAFVDRGEGAKRELDAVDPDGSVHALSGPLVNVGIYRKDGLGLTASNAGLRTYQVVVGFGAGSSSPAEARRFSSTTIAEFSKYWRVDYVPDGFGAKKMDDCK